MEDPAVPVVKEEEKSGLRLRRAREGKGPVCASWTFSSLGGSFSEVRGEGYDTMRWRTTRGRSLINPATPFRHRELVTRFNSNNKRGEREVV